MNITRSIVTNANYDKGRAGHTITGIVLHTMVGTWQGAQSRFNNPSSSVSVHYGIGLDGSVHQWVDEADTAWQAGNYGVNLTTIGIEHEDDGNYNDAERTEALYEASASLVADICQRYAIPCDAAHIKKHCDVIDTSRYPGGTACPDALDTEKIISMAAAMLEGNRMTQITAEQLKWHYYLILGVKLTDDDPQIQNYLKSGKDYATITEEIKRFAMDKHRDYISAVNNAKGSGQEPVNDNAMLREKAAKYDQIKEALQ